MRRCKQCGKSLEGTHLLRKYCNSKCQYQKNKDYYLNYGKEWDRENKDKREAYRKKAHLKKRGKIYCKECGKELRYGSFRKKYCNDECSRKGHIKNVNESQIQTSFLGKRISVYVKDDKEDMLKQIGGLKNKVLNDCIKNPSKYLSVNKETKEIIEKPLEIELKDKYEIRFKKSYLRTCRRCKRNYETSAKYSMVCDKCNQQGNKRNMSEKAKEGWKTRDKNIKMIDNLK